MMRTIAAILTAIAVSASAAAVTYRSVAVNMDDGNTTLIALSSTLELAFEPSNLVAIDPVSGLSLHFPIANFSGLEFTETDALEDINASSVALIIEGNNILLKGLYDFNAIIVCDEVGKVYNPVVTSDASGIRIVANSLPSGFYVITAGALRFKLLLP